MRKNFLYAAMVGATLTLAACGSGKDEAATAEATADPYAVDTGAAAVDPMATGAATDPMATGAATGTATDAATGTTGTATGSVGAGGATGTATGAATTTP